MAVIDPIYNGESGPSVRDKINELIDTVNSGSTTINVGDAPLYDPNKVGGYEAGSIVSYKNESSPDPEFQEFAIYLALTDIPQGVGPEDSADWKNEGASVEVAGGNTANGVVQNITRLRELTGMRTGHTVAVQSEGAIYVFNEASETGVKPFAPGIGSWRKRGDLAFANIARVFTQHDAAEGDEVSCPLSHTIINFAQAGNVTIVDDNGDAALNIVFDGPCIVRRIAAPFVLSSFEITPLNTLGGGHVFENQSGTALPTRNVAKAGEGIEFEDDEEGEKTVVRASKNLTDHIDGEDEEEHQTSQIYDGLNPLSGILPQLVNLQDIDVSDINVGEKKIIVAEKDAGGNPIFAGGVGLLDVIANPGLATLLSETNPNWVGDEITLTGNNLEGQLGENSQFFELDADFFLCKAHDNGTTTSNGSATWKRNRGADCLQLSIAAHATIVRQLETETGWNAVAQFKQIAAKSKLGSWFRRSSGGYLYMCLDTSNGWTRVGTPPTVDLEITTTSHPVLTASLAAHDFTTNRFYVEGTEPADEPAEQGQEWWDTTNKYVYRRNMDGNWARLNG